MLELSVNRVEHHVDVPGEMPLLWVLRDELGLTGTKYGCGIGRCGACSVLIDGVAVRSCTLRADQIATEITTIEGIGTPDNLDVVQQAWIQHQVAQCGYCQSGQSLLRWRCWPAREPGDKEIDAAFAGNLCRCGTYARIRQAVKSAAAQLHGGDEPGPAS